MSAKITYKKITDKDVVSILKKIGASCPATTIVSCLEINGIITTTRAVATAARKAVNDGRISIHYRQGRGYYRFVRVKPKFVPTGKINYGPPG